MTICHVGWDWCKLESSNTWRVISSPSLTQTTLQSHSYMWNLLILPACQVIQGHVSGSFVSDGSLLPFSVGSWSTRHQFLQFLDRCLQIKCNLHMLRGTFVFLKACLSIAKEFYTCSEAFHLRCQYFCKQKVAIPCRWQVSRSQDDSFVNSMCCWEKKRLTNHIWHASRKDWILEFSGRP